MINKKLKVLDLFSGIGGFSLGLQKTNYFETTLFCEIEKHCQRVLSKHFLNTPIHSDVKTLHVTPNEYDVMCGGFPCQDISIGGKGAGITGARSGLWFEFKRLIAEGKPKYVIIENVNALLSRGLSQILQDLAEVGYDASWTVFDSKYFGVPQRRRRVYIIGVRDGIPASADIFEFGRRDNSQHKQQMAIVDKSFTSNFEEKCTGRKLSYWTTQRSNQLAECGLSNTIAKRDYKSATDLVLDNGKLRRVTPEERLRLQGFPDNWFDDCGLSTKQKFQCNGMTVPVVKHIGELIQRFDNERI